MKNDFLTLLLVPDRQGPSKRFRFRLRWAYGVGLAGLMVVGVMASVLVHYVFLVDRVFEADKLSKQNQELTDRLADVSTKMDAMESKLAQVDRLDEKLRSMTSLADAARGLATGPLRSALAAGGGGPDVLDPFAVALPTDEPEVEGVRAALFDSHLVGLAHEADRQIRSLSELVDYFTGQEALLSSTPSIWPTRGWLTSDFGMRDDPYTGERTMHKGVDLAAPGGTKVLAPADGVVIFAGPRGAYGQMVVLEHGRGIVTYYGHLSRKLVKVGDTVERGRAIGGVGNTGRSTGPHLHYEVRIDGVPVNPRRFVLY